MSPMVVADLYVCGGLLHLGIVAQHNGEDGLPQPMRVVGAIFWPVLLVYNIGRLIRWGM